MQRKALTLAVVALLAFGASGVVTASFSPNLSAATTAQSPTDIASSANHTVEVVDPHDRLSKQEVETAWQLAWVNESVTRSFDDDASVHFHVEAVGDELEVYVAPNSTAAPHVRAVVDRDSKSVVAVEELRNVAMAEEAKPMTLSPASTSDVDAGDVVVVESASANETHTVDEESGGEEFSVAVTSSDPDRGTFRVVDERET